MKKSPAFFLMLSCAIMVFGQQKEKIIEDVNNQVEIIDSNINFDTESLEPTEFLKEMPHHGSELIGYFEHGRLKKMVKTIGTATADVVTNFYFWNEQLVHVSYKQRPYLKLDGGGMDYSNAYTKFESKHYFSYEKEAAKRLIGVPLPNITPVTNFLGYANKIKSLLDNKFKNQEVYKALAGRWVYMRNTDESVVFDGGIRINYRANKFINKLKMKVVNNELHCWSPTSGKKDTYKIEVVTDSTLAMRCLSLGELFVYNRVE